MNLPKIYEPAAYEADIYALWEKTRTFQPQGKGKPYSIVVPPPNANGDLHIGHALTLGIEDIVVRYHRLRGARALLLPGADHAGFETQVVYEKRLAKEGKSRFDFTREQLYSQIWDFVAENRQNFENQLRRLGAGVDWSRYTFTLDPKIVRRAYATFQKMWNEGLIYRGKRLVNFCTYHGTAFADIEVVYKEEKSKLWFIRYPLTDGSGDITVATTRPETMFGDTAVAVNPSDKRYMSFIGKTVKLPLTQREIPIIADEFVEETFGTGAVKITPAHDPNDFEVGKRHALPSVTVIDHEGKLTHEVPESYHGLPVDVARKQVVSDLEIQKFLVRTEDYAHNVGHCYKCGTVIQPLLREQWFVDMQPLTAPAIKVLRAGEITFYPDTKREQLITYLENLRDWNISRQIAWGIPIPAFQNIDNPEEWIYDERVDQEIIEVEGKTYHRDPDVFDTWFSSSSWPYATLNYPDDPDFEDFYPLSLMETGGEILYPWVSRMLMLGLYITGKVPFKSVYIHGYVMAEDGSKMSKSLGNVINPLDVIEEYGSDAMRMGIIAGRVPAVNRGYDRRKVEDARNFCNKVWNIARYIEGIAGTSPDVDHAEPITAADHWVLHKLQQTQLATASDLDDYRLGEAYERLYHFVWDDLADWYIEASKAEPNLPLLARVFTDTLVLLHPFAPFVTETIWQTLNWTGESVLALQGWPKVPKADAKKVANFADLQAIVSEVRFITKTLGVNDVTLYYTDVPFLTEHAALVKRLARLGSVTEVRNGTGLFLTSTPHRCWLDIDQSTANKFVTSLEAKQTAQRAIVARLGQRLDNDAYVRHAPREIVEQTKQQLTDAREQLAAIDREYDRFKSIRS